MSNSVGLLPTLTIIHAKTIDALKEYPWMMTGSEKPPPVSNVRRPSDFITLEGWFDKEIGPLSLVVVSLVAGVSSSIATATSHSLDTSKSLSQCVLLLKFVSMERKFLKWNSPGKRFERLTGIHPADRNLLMNGVWLWMARSGLASFVVVGSYFLEVDDLVAQ
ncbi:Mitochondrial substrate carrier family protein [Abeliophyllum distichum]|uniref:Mitochondrial substrate carrier family protein n=1 Tax=Abeliophyllum distichum TaxID=126358 RepID=A0ABD1TK84_9LAMI